MEIKEKVIRIVEIFKALGDPVRLKIIRILASKMEDKLCVNDLVEKFGISQPAVSQHLKILKTIGILNSVKEGYKVYYSINADSLMKYKHSIDILFEVFSAIGTVGMSTGITRNLNIISRIIIIFLMYCGRIGSLTFALSIGSNKKTVPVTQPTEKITIG